MNRSLCSPLWLGLSLLLLAGCSRPAPALPSVPLRTEPWDPKLVASIAKTPLQDGGRVKPFATLAAFTLYFVHGRRDLQYSVVENGATKKITLEPTEWLLDVWCFPEQAKDYPLFRVENTSVLDALGIANEGQSLNFHYLSYSQLLPVGGRLDSLAKRYEPIAARDRSLVQEHIVHLDAQLSVYHRLHQQLGCLHASIQVEGDELRQVFGGASNVPFVAVLQKAEPFVALVRSVGEDVNSSNLGNAMGIIEVLGDVATHDRGPLLFPPSSRRDDTWHSLADVIEAAMRGHDAKSHVALLGHLQDAFRAADMTSRARSLMAWHDEVIRAAHARGELASVELETQDHRSNWQYWSIHWFLLGFMLAAASWILPRNRLVWWASMAVTTIALGLLVYDVVLRCLITGRPPIKNLYDTFLFIASVSTLLAIVAECIVPRRIALALAPLLGALLVMFARMFEVTKGEDTMAPLVAVLDSNFWLATHVTTINIGYAAGLLAALAANVWILLRVLRLAHPNDVVAKSLVRVTYGITCFSLMFSVVGTILGGVWANDSWGRFWGWDPKENGALLICISQIAVLHARMSGLVRDFGFIVWCTVTGITVLFSWFHVNLLGVGLHNYGFSSGLRDAVWTGYTIELGFVVLGSVDVLLRPNPAPVTRSAAVDDGLPSAV